MPPKNLFAAIQDQLDTMSQALNDCVDNETSEDEMWSEIETACQALAQMSMGTDSDEDEDELDGDDEDEVSELDFDGDAERDDEGDDEDGDMH